MAPNDFDMGERSSFATRLLLSSCLSELIDNSYNAGASFTAVFFEKRHTLPHALGLDDQKMDLTFREFTIVTIRTNVGYSINQIADVLENVQSPNPRSTRNPPGGMGITGIRADLEENTLYGQLQYRRGPLVPQPLLQMANPDYPWSARSGLEASLVFCEEDTN